MSNSKIDKYWVCSKCNSAETSSSIKAHIKTHKESTATKVSWGSVDKFGKFVPVERNHSEKDPQAFPTIRENEFYPLLQQYIKPDSRFRLDTTLLFLQERRGDVHVSVKRKLAKYASDYLSVAAQLEWNYEPHTKALLNLMKEDFGEACELLGQVLLERRIKEDYLLLAVIVACFDEHGPKSLDERDMMFTAVKCLFGYCIQGQPQEGSLYARFEELCQSQPKTLDVVVVDADTVTVEGNVISVSDIANIVSKCCKVCEEMDLEATIHMTKKEVLAQLGSKVSNITGDGLLSNRFHWSGALMEQVQPIDVLGHLFVMVALSMGEECRIDDLRSVLFTNHAECKRHIFIDDGDVLVNGNRLPRMVGDWVAYYIGVIRPFEIQHPGADYDDDHDDDHDDFDDFDNFFIDTMAMSKKQQLGHILFTLPREKLNSSFTTIVKELSSEKGFSYRAFMSALQHLKGAKSWQERLFPPMTPPLDTSTQLTYVESPTQIDTIVDEIDDSLDVTLIDTPTKRRKPNDFTSLKGQGIISYGFTIPDVLLFELLPVVDISMEDCCPHCLLPERDGRCEHILASHVIYNMLTLYDKFDTKLGMRHYFEQMEDMRFTTKLLGYWARASKILKTIPVLISKIPIDKVLESNKIYYETWDGILEPGSRSDEVFRMDDGTTCWICQTPLDSHTCDFVSFRTVVRDAVGNPDMWREVSNLMFDRQVQVLSPTHLVSMTSHILPYFFVTVGRLLIKHHASSIQQFKVLQRPRTSSRKRGGDKTSPKT